MPLAPYSNHDPIFARRLIAHNRKAALIIVRKAIAHRKFRRSLALHNPGAVQFYPENLDLLAGSLKRHRKLIAGGYASLRAAERDAAEIAALAGRRAA